MKTRLFKIVSLGLLLALLCGAALPALAAPKTPKLHAQMAWVGKNIAVKIDNLPSSAKYVVEAITSSNPAVAEAGFSEGTPYAWLVPKKAGKTRVTLTYRLNDQTKKLSAVYRVKAYPNPFAALKLNGSKVNLKKNPFEITFAPFKKTSVKVAFSLNKNWKVVALTGERMDDDDMGEVGAAFTWENKKAFKLSSYENAVLTLKLKNRKSGDIFEYTIYIYR